VQRLEALGKSINDFPILSHTLPPTSQVDGLLGLDFFRGFQISRFSQRNNYDHMTEMLRRDAHHQF
jgi:hypothetical protein